MKLRLILAICLSILATSCSSKSVIAPIPPLGSHTAPLEASGGATAAGFASPDTGGGTLAFQIKEPNRGGKLGYVSPATKGLTVAVTGPQTFTRAFKITRANPSCVGSPLVCTITVALKAGNYTTSLTLFDLAPVGGQIPFNAKVLSFTVSNISFSIKIGKSTSISPTFGGVEGSVTIGNLPQSCTSFPATSFPVTAFDPYGFKIVGPYAFSITMTDGDTSGATTIATSGKDNPPPDTLVSSSDIATLAWNGNPIPGGSATIRANAEGPISGEAQFTPGAAPGSVLFSFN